MPRPSVYEFAGGDPAFLALAAAHHERCLEEQEISHAFSHGFNPAHIENLAFYWAEVFGGPNRYSALHGGHSGMLEMHARTGAAEDWGQRFLGCFVQAMERSRVAERPGRLTQAVHGEARCFVSVAVRFTGGDTRNRDSVDVVGAH